MTSWDLGQQEEDLENSKFRERAFHESIYYLDLNNFRDNIRSFQVCCADKY